MPLIQGYKGVKTMIVKDKLILYVIECLLEIRDIINNI